MKTLSIFIIVFTCMLTTSIFSQEQYTIAGKTYTLNTEVEGTLTLLWKVIDEDYRYFAKKGNEIVELTNTRVDGKYQEEYKATLRMLASDQSMAADKVNLTLVSLRGFFNEYNKKADPNYVENSTSVNLETRLGAFGGLSNNVATTNPDNVFAPLIGLEFEVTDSKVLRRHAAVLQFRHSLQTADYEVSYSQFSLLYRYKFIHNEKLSVFVQGKFVALTFFNIPEDNEEELENLSGSSLQTPMGIGIGMDYKLGNGFITFTMNDIVAPGLDTNGEFSMDFTLGYKFIL